METRRPRRYTVPEMRRAGVEVLDLYRVHLRCMRCGHAWSPNMLAGGRLPRGYWQCDNGCNVPQDKAK